MTPPRQRLLSRYRDAAQTLATSPTRHAHGDLLDGEAPALHDLLTRQALSLVRLHDAVADVDADARDAKPSADTALVQGRLEDLASVTTSKLYAYRYDRVPYHWRQMHADTLILRTFLTALHDGLGPTGADPWLSPVTLDRIVEDLDRVLITAGDAGVLGRDWIERTLALLEHLDRRARQPRDTPDKHDDDASRPRKQRTTRPPDTWPR
ncbi:hypothetical protein E4U42_005584, partial [Claviceps africana]